MSHPDNHIDEMFRRAADNYQLNTRNGQWDDVATKLSLHNESRASNNSGFTFLLLLIFLLGVLFRTYDLDTSEYTAKDIYRTYQSGINFNRPLNIQTAEHNTKSNIKAVKQNSAPIVKIKKARTKLVTKNQKANELLLPVIKIKKFTAVYTKDSLRTINVLYCNEIRTSVSHENSSNDFLQSEKIKLSNSKPVTRFSGSLVNSEIKNYKAGMLNNGNLKKQSPFYLNLIFGLSFTEVKNQKLTKPGIEIGIKTGYRLSNNLLLETGLIFSKKYYYSDGKYFKMENNDPSMPGGMQILNLNGNSAIFQVPLKLKVDVIKDQKKVFFTAVGFSTFFLSREKNNYRTLFNGTEQQINVTYPKGQRYFAASADISAGYQFNVYKKRTIRVEPYLQIPLKGIGVGKMPLTGAGIQIGYSIF